MMIFDPLADRRLVLRLAGYGLSLLIYSNTSATSTLRNPFLVPHNSCQNNWQHWQYQGLVQQGSRARALLHRDHTETINTDLADPAPLSNISSTTFRYNTMPLNNGNATWLRVSTGDALPGGGTVLHLTTQTITLLIDEHCPAVTLSFLPREPHHAQAISSDSTVSAHTTTHTVTDSATTNNVAPATSQRSPDSSSPGKTSSQ